MMRPMTWDDGPVMLLTYDHWQLWLLSHWMMNSVKAVIDYYCRYDVAANDDADDGDVHRVACDDRRHCDADVVSDEDVAAAAVDADGS